MPYASTKHKPRYGDDLKRNYAGESPAVYKPTENKWYNSSVGAELVTNGGFSDGLTGWTVGGTTTPTVSNGLLTLTTGTTNGYAYRTIATTIGKKYKIVPRFSTSTGTYLDIALSYPFTTVIYHSPSLGSVEFTAESVTTTITLSVGQVAGSVTVDSISVFEAVIEPTTEITASRNYLDAIVYADAGGQPAYVEQLPKTTYFDEVKANEFKGKNACTAWVNFDGTTTPPTIRDSYNVKAVVRTATGAYDIYFEKPMDNTNYAVSGLKRDVASLLDGHVNIGHHTFAVNKFSLGTVENNSNVNSDSVFIQVFGGK